MAGRREVVVGAISKSARRGNRTKFESIIQDTPHPSRSAWMSIQVPTLVLANRLDPVHPFDYAEELARTIPGAAFRELTPKSTSLQQHEADVRRWLVEYFDRHFLKVAPR